ALLFYTHPPTTESYTLSLHDALPIFEGILSRVGPLSAERVEIMGALGRVLAEPIVSRATIPPWPNSSMDGYAVRAQDTNGEPVRSEEHTSELQSRFDLVCRLLLEKKK